MENYGTMTRLRTINMCSYNYVPSQIKREMIRNTIQAKCLPRVSIRVIIKLADDVSKIIFDMAIKGEDISRVNRIAASANQAMVNKCHAKRIVRPVSTSLLKILGRLPHLNKGMSIKRSPKYE